MAFRFAPRTLLELGKELISSDHVAIYELIKNAIDAGSPRVEIAANIILPELAYTAALDALEDGQPSREVFGQVRAACLANAPVQDASNFLAELHKSVGRPQRFGHALKVAYRRYNWLEVRDAGHGMSMADLNDIYLTVGTRSRRRDNILGSAYLGDKGVGRLSAMRLGDRLAIRTSKAGETYWNKLNINWRLFTHETERDLSLIPVDPVIGSPKDDPATQGTIIRISALTSNWSVGRFSEVFQGPVARMVDPFEPGLASRLLVARHNGVRVAIPSIPQKLLEAAHATCRAKLRFDPASGEPILEGAIEYAYRNRSRAIAQRGVELLSITQNVRTRRGKKGHAATVAEPIRLKAISNLGPFDVDVFWYNRRIVEAVADLTSNTTETREQIAQWSGGPMLYRRDFRILPYGDPDDDWLELDRNAFGQSGFKLNRRQVVGRIKVFSPHTALSEQTNREGLVRSEAADALRTIVMWLLHSELRQLINEADAEERLSQRQAERATYAFRDTQKQVETSITELRGRVGSAEQRFVDALAAQISLMGDQCQAIIGNTEKFILESSGEREKFVHLAGIGLMTEFIFHELDRAVAHAVRVIADTGNTPTPAALSSLTDQLTTLQKRISAFDLLSGEKRQTKSFFDLTEVVKGVIENHAAEFARHDIKLHFKPPATFPKLKAVRGMAIQILENLVVNSTYWLKQQRRHEPDFKPEIWIEMDPDDLSLTIEDNGPGVDPVRHVAIFEAFVSSKPAGQGRGLGLYISRELAKYHGWQLSMDQNAGRRREKRLNMFVLEMGE